MVEYLIGNQDFYKVIKSKNEVEIQAYNLHGTLNLSFEDKKPKAKLHYLIIPKRHIRSVNELEKEDAILGIFYLLYQISFII